MPRNFYNGTSLLTAVTNWPIGSVFGKFDRRIYKRLLTRRIVSVLNYVQDYKVHLLSLAVLGFQIKLIRIGSETLLLLRLINSFL